MESNTSTYESMMPGLLIKEALAERSLSQREFAKVFGVGPSHINDLIKGRRRITLAVAQKIENLLGIPATQLMSMQTAHDIIKSAASSDEALEKDAQELLDKLETVINVKALLKGVKLIKRTASSIIAYLKENFGITTFEELARSSQQLENSCFRRSAKTGLDTRMITTWVVKARAEAIKHRPTQAFLLTNREEVCSGVSRLLHANDPQADIQSYLSSYGIGFCEVSKLEHASIDGYSFMADGVPYIVITGRYKRIDNLAFTIMHELGHIFLGHTTEDKSNINIDLRSFDDDDVDSPREEEADKFASNYLIPDLIWKLRPMVKVLNPWSIQENYANWAKKYNLNPWIVLGRLSHETGIYRFKSDSSRDVKIQKGGAPMA